MTSLDDIRKKAEEEARNGPSPSFDPSFYDTRQKAEAEALADAEDDIDLSTFVVEDIAGQAALDAAAKKKAGIGKRTRRKTSHWASRAFAACLRQEWLTFKGAVPTDNGGSDEIFGMGEDIEQRVVDKYILSGQFIRTQDYIEIIDPGLRFPITGKIDLLIHSNKDIDLLVQEDDELMAVEVKSCKDFGEDRGYDLWKKYLPKREHVGQLTLYLKALGLARGYLTYFNRQRALRTRYLVTYNEAFYRSIIRHYRTVEESLDGPEPDIPRGINGKRFPCIWFSRAPDKKGQPAGMCPFFSHCWAEHPITLENPGNGGGKSA